MSKERSAPSALTVLFADISRSTHLFEVYGNSRAQGIVSKVISALSRVADEFEGFVIKTIGDAVMCSFSHPEGALRAACRMHECMTQDAVFLDYSISIRIGFHHGDVIRDERNDLFGDAVNLAARMVDLAKAGEIITCRQTVDRLPAELKSRVRRLHTMKVKGKQEEVEIFDVPWQEDTSEFTMAGMTLPSSALSSERKEERKGPVLMLRYGDLSLKVSERKTTVGIGRGKSNDLVIGNSDPSDLHPSKVSRNHASIEYRSGRFVVCDHSRNGTGIVSDNGETSFIHREEYPLHSEGLIILGGPKREQSTETVRYRVVS